MLSGSGGLSQITSKNEEGKPGHLLPRIAFNDGDDGLCKVDSLSSKSDTFD